MLSQPQILSMRVEMSTLCNQSLNTVLVVLLTCLQEQLRIPTYPKYVHGIASQVSVGYGLIHLLHMPVPARWWP